MSETTTIIGNQIRSLRGYRRLTQRELADKAGVSYTTISNVENGDNVSIDILVSICNALNVVIDLKFTPL